MPIERNVCPYQQLLASNYKQNYTHELTKELNTKVILLTLKECLTFGADNHRNHKIEISLIYFNYKGLADLLLVLIVILVHTLFSSL